MRSKKDITIMVFGTFDIIHPGHINMLKQAKKLGDKLIIVVALDKTVHKVKGQKPMYGLEYRINKLSQLDLADKIIRGDSKKYFECVKHEKPDIIALGYDQIFNVEELKKLVAESNLPIKIIRLKPYLPNKYKSSIIKQKLNKKND
jgi:cytidyltransferase-like protein